MTTTTTNGGSPPVPAVGTATEPLPAVSGDRVSDVMARYQALMQRFLETQRAVMLTKARVAFSMAKVSPMHLRAPPPKGMKAPRGRVAA